MPARWRPGAAGARHAARRRFDWADSAGRDARRILVGIGLTPSAVELGRSPLHAGGAGRADRDGRADHAARYRDAVGRVRGEPPAGQLYRRGGADRHCPIAFVRCRRPVALCAQHAVARRGAFCRRQCRFTTLSAAGRARGRVDAGRQPHRRHRHAGRADTGREGGHCRDRA
ncbi:hypothetical protein D9M73_134740 [compost metagenome]